MQSIKNAVVGMVSSRWFAWPLLVAPLLILVHQKSGLAPQAWTDVSEQRFLGNTALGLFLFVLCLTPLKVLFPRSRLVGALNHHRRAIGVSSFLYACSHIPFFFIGEAAGEEVLREIANYPYLLAGLGAFSIVSVMASTSTDWAIHLLRYRWWKRLHRFAYAAAGLLFLHRSYGPQGTWDETLLLFSPLLTLESLRVLKQLQHRISLLEQPRPAWEGWRTLRVARREQETADVSSFYLVPVDGKRLGRFEPGQFLTFRLDVPEQERPVTRCYSLSDAWHRDHYRVSIKRVPPPASAPDAPPGISSNFFHDHVREGRELEVRAPSGRFVLDPRHVRRDIVLIAAGIGVTPILAMLNAVAPRHLHRQIWVFYGARSGRDHVQKETMNFHDRQHANVHLRVCYSDPEPTDQLGRDYHFAGRVNVDLLRSHLGRHQRYDFFYCGPSPMMEDLTTGLGQWGVPAERLHYETFGPSSVKSVGAAATTESHQIRFDGVDEDFEWSGDYSSLLELGESNGLDLPSGCRVGNCGTCMLKLEEGEVGYSVEPSFPVPEGSCLMCIGVPKTDVTIVAPGQSSRNHRTLTARKPG